MVMFSGTVRYDGHHHRPRQQLRLVSKFYSYLQLFEGLTFPDTIELSSDNIYSLRALGLVGTAFRWAAG